MKNKRVIIIMIIIIVLILAVISGIFMYNKFQQQELKQLTEEANKLLQQDIINDEIDNEIKTSKNYAIVEKAVKEYITDLKNIYLEIEELNTKISIDTIFSEENFSDNKLENIDKVVDEYNQKGKEYLEKIKKLEQEENIINSLNLDNISNKKDYYIDLYKTIILSDSMKNQYKKIEEKIEKSNDKLHNNLIVISNAKKYLEKNTKSWEIKEGKLIFKNPNIMIEYYNIINQLKK